MKTDIIIMISITVAFLSINAIAQTRFVEGKNIINSETTFEATFIEELLVVWNVKNKHVIPRFKGKYPPLPIGKGDMQVDTAQQRKIIYEVLAHKRAKLHQQQEYVAMTYEFGQNAKVINVVFGLPHDTMISPREIGTIDKRLQKEVKAAFKGIEYLDFSAIPFTQNNIYF